MGDRLVDPYEQQLLGVFESCDDDRKGSLNRDGLSLLCDKLQLEEKGLELIKYLLDGNIGTDSVTFVEFRHGLLALLGEGIETRAESGKDLRGSDLELTEELPEREVSPKFVFGKKKYGRRTRPKETDLRSNSNDDDSDSDSSIQTDPGDSLNNSKLDPAANAQHPKKRKTSNSIGIVKAIPDSEPVTEKGLIQTASVTSGSELNVANYDSEVQCLRNAWKRLGVGSGGYLDRNELALVCDHIGMENVAKEVVKEVFDILDVDNDNRISFEEFLQLFRVGGRVEDMPHHFESRINSNLGNLQSVSCLSDNNTYFWTLDINGNGFVSADLVVEVWENAGVIEARSLLHHLGFTGPQLNVIELMSAVDNEINCLQAANNSAEISPTVTLLQASLAVCVAQIRSIKMLLEQVGNERDKLRSDTTEANERASLLAQEVDEHHSRMEYSYKANIKSLEVKHADQVKRLTDHVSLERDNLTQQSQKLQKRVWELEDIETQHRVEVIGLHEESSQQYKENRTLVEQLATIEVDYAAARKELETLDGLRQGIREMELNNDREKMVLLLDKVNDIQSENTELRDRNDELTMKVEALSLELAAVSLKKAGPQHVQDDGDKRMMEQEYGVGVDETIVPGGATKRRGDPPLSISACEESSEEESPRLEKVRRWSSSADDVSSIGSLSRTMTPGSSGVNLFNLDDFLAPPRPDSAYSPSPTEASLKIKIASLKEQVKVLMNKLTVIEAEHQSRLAKSNNPTSSQSFCYHPSQRAEYEETKKQLEKQCKDLKDELGEVKIEIVTMLTERNACNKENSALKVHMNELIKSLGIQVHPDKFKTTEEPLDVSEAGKIDSCTSQAAPSVESKPSFDGNMYLTSKEIERDIISLLKSEFEDKFSMIVEDHTKEKIELLERCTNLESSIELLRQEYERCEDYWAGKLEEERVLFDNEQQVLDKKYKKVLAELKEYESFFHDEQANNGRRLTTIDESVSLEGQVTALEDECEELRQQLVTDRSNMAKEYQTRMDQMKVQNHSSTVLDVGVQVSDCEQLSEACILAAHNELVAETEEQERKKNEASEAMDDELDDIQVHCESGCSRIACQADIKVIETMNARWKQHEQRNRNIQTALKQRQRHTDILLEHTWIRHRKEVTALEIILETTQKNFDQQKKAYMELYECLGRNDILVKDLFVENSHLKASMQQLEQRCLVLAHKTTDSVSV